MSAEVIGTLILASVAVLGSIGSVLLLAFRVGALTGRMDARMSNGEADREQIWKAIGAITDRFNRHTETHNRAKR